MEEFAKVEKLVEVTGVSFEDARNAIRACDGDILDAMVYLEKLGKVSSNKSNSIDPRFAPISETEIAAAAAKREEKSEEVKCEKKSGGFGEFLRKVIRFLTHNKITISKDGREFASIPLLVAFIILNVSVGFAVVAVFVSMMLGYEYSLNGISNFDAANKAIADVSTTAGTVKAEYDRL